MSRFISSPATPFGGQAQAGMSAIAQGEAERAQREAEFEASMNQHKLDQEQAKTENQRARTETAQLALETQRRAQDAAAQSQQAEFAQQSQENAKQQQFNRQLQESAHTHSEWMAQKEQDFQKQITMFNAKVAFLPMAQQAKLRSIAAGFEAKHTDILAKSHTVQKALDGALGNVNFDIQKVRKQGETLQATSLNQQATGASAAPIAIQMWRTHVNAAQSNSVGGKISSTLTNWFENPDQMATEFLQNIEPGGSGVVHEGLLKVPYDISKQEVFRGYTPSEMASSLTDGIRQTLASGGMDATQATKLAAGMAPMVKTVLDIGRLTEGGHSEANEAALNAMNEQLKQQIAETGASPSLIKGILNGLAKSGFENSTVASGGGSIQAVIETKLLGRLSRGAAHASTLVNDPQEAAKTLIGVADLLEGATPEKKKAVWDNLSESQRKVAEPLFRSHSLEDIKSLSQKLGDLGVQDAQAQSGASQLEQGVYSDATGMLQGMLEHFKDWEAGPQQPPQPQPNPWGPPVPSSGQMQR